MFQGFLLINLIIISTFSSSHSASITTLSSSSYHHFELVSNKSYRNFFLRQYFIHLLNISHSSLVHSMIHNHHLIIKLEQIDNNRRKRMIDTSLSSSNCLRINNNQIQSTFQWSHSIKPLTAIELIYHINSLERKISSIPINILFKQSQTLVNLLTINTYLQFDSLRDLYFIHIYDYLNEINAEDLIIETIISNQTCQTFHTYMIISSLKSTSYNLQHSSVCKVKTIQIKFEELGLAHLIVRPKEYLFTYCDGSCEYSTFQKQQQQSSMHAFIQSMLSRKHSNIPKPNCVPSQFADDNFLLRQTDGTIGIYPIKAVIVKQCACL